MLTNRNKTTRIRILYILKMLAQRTKLYTGGALYIRRERYYRFFCRAPAILRISDIFNVNLSKYRQIKMDFQNK